MSDEMDAPLEGSTLFRKAAQMLVETPLLEILRCLDGARAGNDVEAIHDLRVATRRLRAVISVIEPIYLGKPLRKFERSISDMTDHLGEARDTDVFIEFVTEYLATEAAEMAPFERVGVEAFRDSLRQMRGLQQRELETALAKVDERSLRESANAVFGTEAVD